MKNTIKKASVVALASMALVGCKHVNPADNSGGDGSSEYTGTKTVITVDGGGDIHSFNSTEKMEKTEQNPYPYNTLEKLCEEWEATHPEFKVQVQKTSVGGDRGVLLPQLKNHQSADIIYQNGNLADSDLGQDFYADLTPYLEAPNPYNDNKPWKEVYSEGELATTVASDGKYYYVNLEKIPVCFMYNKTLLNAAGVEHPENIATFGQLLAAMDTLDNYIATAQGGSAEYATYSTTYTWYQLAMESNLFSDLVPLGDVIRPNGIVDQEEMCRLIDKEIYQPAIGMDKANNYSATEGSLANNRYYDFIKLIERLDSHKAPLSYFTSRGWGVGKLGFMEATGAELRDLSALETDFEWDTIPFPDITVEDDPNAHAPVVRGSAGLATSWWISNSAIDGGKAKVDACADLLMFLTSPAQNNRLIGDLKGGIPLNPTADFELADYLKPLVGCYEEDIKKVETGERVYWSAFNTRAALGNNYQDSFIRTMQSMDSGTTTALDATCYLARSIDRTAEAFIIENDYSWDF